MYYNCPILWVSKIQTEITLSTTEAEYITLSQAMRDIISLMELLRELNANMNIPIQKPKVKCSVFEDNNGAIELTKVPKICPRTKHIGIKYHHFRKHVSNGNIKILPIDTLEQIADTFTKSLSRELFERLRKKLIGW